MAGLRLFGFQSEAVKRLRAAAVEYYKNGPDKVGGRIIPFVGRLKAVTGAGKTPILAKTVAGLGNSIVLWTTKFGSVVDQTAINLSAGGKYSHLLGKGYVEVIKFNELPSSAAWQRILERKSGITILISTVAAWNSSVKDERLNVHRVHPDWGPKSRWSQLKEDRNRLLWVVYDEAHNTTTEQVEQLDDLDPAGFLIATASDVKGKLQTYLAMLSAEAQAARIASVSTKAVVDAELLKSTIAVADYESTAKEMLRDVVAKRDQLERKLAKASASIDPKTIYVVEASNSTKKEEARPSEIWNILTKDGKVPPSEIAVCTNTRDLPKGAVRVSSISALSPNFKHIIFNKKLQEGWDDPAVYVCYFDGVTRSATRIQQVIGRAMRQPDVNHFSDEDLNTAYFYINCPSTSLENIIDELKEELRIYKGDGEPEDFEPFKFREERKVVPRIPIKRQWAGKLKAPRLQLEIPADYQLVRFIRQKTFDFTEGDRSAPGRAMVRIVSVRTGATKEKTRDLIEDMRIECGTFLQEQIRSLSKACLNCINPEIFQTEELTKTLCYGSKAAEHYKSLGQEVVRDYENHVRLGRLVDPDRRDHVFDEFQPLGSGKKPFKNAAHPYYDSDSLSPDELEVAKALDSKTHVWLRNRDRLDYSIPLPMKSGTSSRFFPDFIWWVKKTVWAIDPTGKIFLDEKLRTKLLTTPAPLRIALLTRGELDSQFRSTSTEGWALLRFRTGNASPENFKNVKDLLSALERES